MLKKRSQEPNQKKSFTQFSTLAQIYTQKILLRQDIKSYQLNYPEVTYC